HPAGGRCGRHRAERSPLLRSPPGRCVSSGLRARAHDERRPVRARGSPAPETEAGCVMGVELRDDLPGGRRELLVRLGPFDVVVTEIPARSLTDHEWQDVLLARRSYAVMWGADGAHLAEDPIDGREAAVYDTRHYLAWIRDGGDAAKLVTMRTVRLR